MLYANAVAKSGTALTKGIGFIYETKICFVRPGGGNKNQRCLYSSHKLSHSFPCQTVTDPDRLVLHMFGPCEDR